MDIIQIQKQVDFTIEMWNDEIRVDVRVYTDGVAVVDAKVPAYGGPVWLEELMICEDGDLPSVEEIADAIDRELERRYDEWCERQYSY
jgi:hypothetical protein